MKWLGRLRVGPERIGIAPALTGFLGQLVFGGGSRVAFALAVGVFVIIVGVELVDATREGAMGKSPAGRLAIYLGAAAAWALCLAVAFGAFGDVGGWQYPLYAVALCLVFLPRYAGDLRPRARREAR